MKIKEAQYEPCASCGRTQQISDDEYGCDHCQAPMNMRLTDADRNLLEATVWFSHGSDGETLHFCSWRCCLTHLKTLPVGFFVSLPFLHYDKTQPGIRAQDFFEAIGQ